MQNYSKSQLFIRLAPIEGEEKRNLHHYDDSDEDDEEEETKIITLQQTLTRYYIKHSKAKRAFCLNTLFSKITSSQYVFYRSRDNAART